MKMKNNLLNVLVVLSTLLIFSCGNNEDDGVTFIPARDRTEEAPAATAIVEEYLQTHFYNYEEFANPPAGFDFKIKFDTIAGDNANKIPLIDQVSFKMVPDRLEDGLMYKLYYLSVIEGEGETVNFPDIATVTYEGYTINRETTAAPYSRLFDSSNTPVNFDLTNVVNGFQDGVIEFKTATNFITNPDGTLTFENYGVGAVFMQNGLGYYVSAPAGSNIPVYSQLIFTFQVFDRREGDQDNDGVPSILEDRNGNKIEEDDDTDGDGLPDFVDPDDDEDGRPTRDEIEIDADGNITYPDVDNDGIPDYLDSDS